MKSRLATLAVLSTLSMSAPSALSGISTDLLLGTQTYGAPAANRSVSGGALAIGGIRYPRGIGTHATSEIPVSIPAGATAFSGACGMDTGSEGAGKARFRILSGSAVLWTSPVLKTGGKAVAFKVSLPAGATRLYLQVNALENNHYDHADWVNLNWKTDGDAPAARKAVTFRGEDFGLKPGSSTDQSGALRKAIDALRAAPGSTLVLEKGTYHFRRTGALNKHYHPSNHDQPDWQPVSIPLVDLRDVTLDGGGSLFLFHGQVQPVLVQDTAGLTVKNLSLDYAIPPDSQGTVTRVGNGFYEMSIDATKYPHKIENGWITFTGENWEAPDGSHGIVFSGKTGEIVPKTGDFAYRGELTVIRPGHYRVARDIGKSGVARGDLITLRHGWDRPHPGMVLYRAKDTRLLNLVIHASHGMALLAQRSENIHLKGGGVFPRQGTGRRFSAGADATHFSNCRGSIIAEGGRYEGMMDDAINVHATCLRIEQKTGSRVIRCRYVHNQAYGFETFLPGETLRFIRAKWLTPRSPNKVESVRWIDNKQLEITLEDPIPADLGPGDAVENADWFPSVQFRNNTVRNNRARGSLFTTPHPVVIEGNTFETIAGSAILLAGDANGWYESGACRDVLIRNNTFRNNLTSRFQFTEAIISIFPEIPDLKGQKQCYHRNVRITGNTFETFDVPLVFAISTDGLTFSNNKVVYNDDYRAWKKPPFILRKCRNVKVTANSVSRPPVRWTKSSAFDLQLTPASEVTLD